MPYLPLALPPGMYRNGTTYQGKGRWVDGNLVRWGEGKMGPVGGWRRFGRGYTFSTNLALQSNRLDLSPWSVQAGSVTFATAASWFGDGSTARRLIDPGSSAQARVGQVIGVTTGDPESVAVVIERISGATVSDVILRSAVGGGTTIVQARLTWSTLEAVVTNDPGAETDTSFTRVVSLGTGPNGGPMVRLILGAEPIVPGEERQVRIFPSGAASMQAAEIVIHHVQMEEAADIGNIIITGSTPVTAENGRIVLDSPACGILGWRSNDGVPHMAVGTVAGAYAYVDGVLRNLNPDTFTPGDLIAGVDVGVYGSGGYGVGFYGLGDITLQTFKEGNTWQFDTFGEVLVGVAQSDRKIRAWDLEDNSDLDVISEAPDADGVVVTNERFLVALGADGDGRKVQWADQESLTDWTPTTENQAGDFLLPGVGSLLAGKRARTETLLWTTNELFAMTYIAGTLIYSFKQVGSACGAISRRAMVVVEGGKAFWMGNQGFFGYNGFTASLSSSVGDYVFGDMNAQQVSQICCVSLAEQNAIRWYYPSSGATYNNRYVEYNYLEDTWATGNMHRTGGIDRGPFQYPMSIDRFGVVYEDEVGTDYRTYLGVQMNPTATSGPIEIAQGDQVLVARQIVPDENTLGDVNMTIRASLYPTAPETVFGPYSMANPTSIRLLGRQIRLRIDQVSPNWRLGTPRLEIVTSGKR